MSTTFTWVARHLKEDHRGFATSMFCERQGVNDSGITESAGVSVSFGGSGYKAKSDWLHSEIDAVAEEHRLELDSNVEAALALTLNDSDKANRQLELDKLNSLENL